MSFFRRFHCFRWRVRSKSSPHMNMSTFEKVDDGGEDRKGESSFQNLSKSGIDSYSSGEPRLILPGRSNSAPRNYISSFARNCISSLFRFLAAKYNIPASGSGERFITIPEQRNELLAFLTNLQMQRLFLLNQHTLSLKSPEEPRERCNHNDRSFPM
jgi:hypothetical protein